LNCREADFVSLPEGTILIRKLGKSDHKDDRERVEMRGGEWKRGEVYVAKVTGDFGANICPQ